MVMDDLAERLRGVMDRIRRAKAVDADLIKQVVRELQSALLRADVDAKLTLKLTKAIEQRALEESPKGGDDSRTHVLRIIVEELTAILGEARRIPIKRQRIMLVGLYGQGKTTSAGKMARYFKKRGLKVGLIAADIHRPAAVDQLRTLSRQADVAFYCEPGGRDAPAIVSRGLAELGGVDVVIIDTAGRHDLDVSLIEEMKAVDRVANPDEKLLVMDATLGRAAQKQAAAFHEAIGVTGVIITKLDGSAKAGGALSAVQTTQAGVVFIGVGEHMDDLEGFDPPAFISRLLGMGDLSGLAERFEGVVKEEDAEAMARRILRGKFTLYDLRSQMDMVNSAGTFKKLVSFFPGMGGAMTDAQLDATEDQIRKFRIIMNSMHSSEMEDPTSIKHSNMLRIAQGAGMRPEDVKELLRYHRKARKQMRSFSGDRGKMRKLKQMMESGVGMPPMGPFGA